MDDDKDDEAEPMNPVNPEWIKCEEIIIIMRSERISSPPVRMFFPFQKGGFCEYELGLV